MPFQLSNELRKVAVGALKTYLEAPPLPSGRTPIQVESEGDRQRIVLIEGTIRPLVVKYLGKGVSTADFKRQIDGINKQNPLWGFGGIKGQMFFNMVVKVADDPVELDSQLRLAIRAPATEDDAVATLRNFKNYVVRIGQQFVDSGGDAFSRPKAGSVAFFLSYFWQIQKPSLWPVYYTNSVQVIEGMNLWQATGEVGEDYVTYKHLHESLVELFSQSSRTAMGLYDVEHVFWFKSGKLLEESPRVANEREQTRRETYSPEPNATLSDSYIPPIIAAIPKLAANDPEFQELAKRSGTTLERALEKSVNAAFTVLGYETHLLGQGMGRVPDGQAIAVDESYALLWDTKARVEGYKMGTDDRVIRQYIESQSRSLKRSRGLRNIYYLIISSGFADQFDELIRLLKMETHVNEVCLVEAAALIAIVDQKLRAPLSISLGPDGIQRLFSSSGRVTQNDVLENLA